MEDGAQGLNAVRRKRLSEVEAVDAHRDFALLPIRCSDSTTPADIPAIHALAQRRRLTFYDATYLNLALGQGARLASLDEALERLENVVAGKFRL